eukprot:385081-Rhodomonas_salina.1
MSGMSTSMSSGREGRMSAAHDSSGVTSRSLLGTTRRPKKANTLVSGVKGRSGVKKAGSPKTITPAKVAATRKSTCSLPVETRLDLSAIPMNSGERSTDVTPRLHDSTVCSEASTAFSSIHPEQSITGHSLCLNNSVSLLGGRESLDGASVLSSGRESIGSHSVWTGRESIGSVHAMPTFRLSSEGTKTESDADAMAAREEKLQQKLKESE